MCNRKKAEQSPPQTIMAWLQKGDCLCVGKPVGAGGGQERIIGGKMIKVYILYMYKNNKWKYMHVCISYIYIWKKHNETK
jgi:hypothetical protein